MKTKQTSLDAAAHSAHGVLITYGIWLGLV
jgi:hypothetical protein